MSDQADKDLASALRDAYPELEAIAAAADGDAWLVGGAVRDALLGRGRSDNVDVVLAGDVEPVLARLGGSAVEHERFATAKLDLDGLEVDLTSARTETYARPGALPDVETGATIEDDLRRRDFSVNAIAVGLRDGAVVDPLGGRADLESGLLRTLHPASLADDPTRALRAARYAARLGLAPAPETARQLAAADLSSVSADRRRADLRRIAAETQALRGFELLDEWGLVEFRAGGLDLAARARTLIDDPLWGGFAPRDEVLLRAAFGPEGEEREIAALEPDSPSAAVAAAEGRDRVVLVLARALGAEWLDEYLRTWSQVELAIDGADLVAAGVPEGPGVGAGLAAARRAKLDGELDGRDQELAAALAAARTGTDS